MPTLIELPPWLLRIFALAFGLLWGSFLNVVIHRVPLGLSVVRPSSRCPHCETPIRPWNNIPILSWLLLRGKTACCGTKISPRYVLVEAIGALLAVAIVEALVLPMPPQTPALHALMVFLSALALALGLTAAAFIDIEHMYIPDVISYGAIVMGLATVSFRPSLTYAESLLAGCAGFLLVWLVFGVLYRKLRGVTGMGLGDAKLLAVAGVWFGWKGLAFALFAGAVQGTMAALLVLMVRGKVEEPQAVQQEREAWLAEVAAIKDKQEREKAEAELLKDPIFEQTSGSTMVSRIAFGPFLVLAIVEYLLAGTSIVDHYVTWAGY